MIVLPNVCKTDLITLRRNLVKIHEACKNFLTEDALVEKLQKAQLCLSVSSGFNFANAFDFFNLVENYKKPENGSAFSFHSNFIQALNQFGYKKTATVIEDYISFAETYNADEISYDDNDPTKAKSEETQNQLEEFDKQFKNCVAEIPIDSLIKKITQFLKVKFVSQEDYDQYWLDKILQSETYLRIFKADTGYHHLRKKRFEFWQDRVLKEKEIEWQFDIWHAPMKNLDEHYYNYGQTNKGVVRLSSGRGMQEQFLIHSWPDLEVFVDIKKSDIPKTQKEIDSEKGQKDLQKMIQAVQKTGALEAKFGNFDTISEVIKAFIPISTWHLGLGVGKLGASNKMLLKLPLVTAFAIGAILFLWFSVDIPSTFYEILNGPYGLISTSLNIILIACIIVLTCGSIWRCIFTAGMYLGTFQRALYGFPITTNLADTNHSNFITKLFGKE